jgi:uncharacterized damage-inducible protein DinB
MSLATEFQKELDQELPATRRLIERLPAEKGPWKPHPKSAAFGHLAQLVVRLTGTFSDIIQGIDLDLAAGPPYSFEPTEALVDEFDRNVARLRETLAHADDDVFALTWNLKYGDQVLGSGLRRDVLRNTINHWVHHRAQLTVYLRLNDLPVPCLYGPTADEQS